VSVDGRSRVVHRHQEAKPGCDLEIGGIRCLPADHPVGQVGVGLSGYLGQVREVGADGGVVGRGEAL
jgi:hypothetical protein